MNKMKEHMKKIVKGTISDNRSKDRNNIKETGKSFLIIKCLILMGFVSYLFYDSFLGVVFTIPAVILLYRDGCKKLADKRIEETENRFKDVLQSVLGSMRAGSSVENAFCDASKDLEYRYGKQDYMVNELLILNRQVQNNVPIDRLIMELATKTGSKDISDFAAVFMLARKSGGDMGRVLGRTIQIITRRREVKQEIELLVAAKKYEQQIMNLMPMGIIGYIRLTNPSYFDPLYHNPFGIVMMTVVLVIYYLAYRMSEKILDGI